MKPETELSTWAGILYQKGLVAGKSGNVSCRVDKNSMMITAHDAYLGYLKDGDLVTTDFNGKILSGKSAASSEHNLHAEIYKKFGTINAVMHAHSPHTTAFFYHHAALESFSFETKFYLGKISVIEQVTPTVTDIAPVLQALENNNVVVLKNHGVVAMGQDFKAAFSLLELLEEQAKVNLLIKTADRRPQTADERSEKKERGAKNYKMLSKEHRDRLVELVNDDKQAQELGKKYDLTCSLAVKNQVSGECMCFHYNKGRIEKADENDNAEFVIIGEPQVLRKVFNRELDPFVASTQGKVKTKGDFAKMSRWYPVMVHTFKLWEQAPVE